MQEQPVALKIIKNLDTAIAAAALVLLIAVTFCGVIMRYIISKPFAWEEEVQLGLIIWVVFFGGRFAFITGNHPSIDMIVNLLPAKIRKYSNWIIVVISVAVLLYAGFQGLKYVLQMFRNHRVTNMLHIPYALIYISLPIGCLLMSVQMIINAYKKRR